MVKEEAPADVCGDPGGGLQGGWVYASNLLDRRRKAPNGLSGESSAKPEQ